MLKKIFVWILAAMLAFSNVGCTSVPQPTMEELLAEVNAEHAAVEQADDFSQYLRKPLGETTFKITQTFPFSDEEFDPQKVLTLEQATEDVDYLFTVFHDTYPLYDYFGGEEAFTAAREKILADCAAAQPLTGEVLVESMIAHLNFVEDRHFSINKQTTQPSDYPFLFREIAFVKTENGYRTEDGRNVERVDGWDNLDELFRRSLDKNGRIVYYPVILEEFKNLSMGGMSTRICSQQLTVHYQGGESQILTAEPFKPYWENQEGNIVIEKDAQFPVIRMKNFTGQGERNVREFMNDLSDTTPLILDMRSNSGGYNDARSSFLNHLFGRDLPCNFLKVNTITGEQLSKEADEFVENDRLVILLVGKMSASQAELFTDALHNLENVLIIGENTAGCAMTGMIDFQLPNSLAKVALNTMGSMHVFPQGDYFEEGRGLLPDIWVPAGEAEELAVKLIENLK